MGITKLTPVLPVRHSPGFSVWLCRKLAEWPWVSPFTSLCCRISSWKRLSFWKCSAVHHSPEGKKYTCLIPGGQAGRLLFTSRLSLGSRASHSGTFTKWHWHKAPSGEEKPRPMVWLCSSGQDFQERERHSSKHFAYIIFVNDQNNPKQQEKLLPSFQGWGKYSSENFRACLA